VSTLDEETCNSRSVEEELALGGGWGDLEDFAPTRLATGGGSMASYKVGDKWPVTSLTEEQRHRIKAKLLRADSCSRPQKKSRRTCRNEASI